MSLRLHLVPVLLAAASLSSSPPDGPRLTWTRSTGDPGWTVPLSAAADGREPSGPLLAPAWFDPAPDITVRLLDGGRFRLSEQRGKIVLLDFWATWCAPCLRELPRLQKLWEEQSPSGRLAVAAINVREGDEIVAEAAEVLGLTFPVGLYDDSIEEAFRVRALPNHVLVDRDGRLRDRWGGSDELAERSVAERIGALFGDDPAAAPRMLGEAFDGPARFSITWARDLDTRVDGIAASSGAQGRILASAGRHVLVLAPDGRTLYGIPIPSAGGRLLLADLDGDRLEEAVSFRPGAAEIVVIDPRKRSARVLEPPEPVLDIAAWPASQRGAPAGRLVLAAQSGVLVMDPESASTRRVEGTSEALDVEIAPDGSAAALGSDRALRWIPEQGPASEPVRLPEGDTRIVAAAGPGGGAASAHATAAAAGCFGPSPGERQIAAATPAGDLAILDLESGTVLWRARWPGIRHLTAADVDGDGRDELLVAAGKTVALLEAAP